MTKRIVIPERILAARKLTGLSLAKFIKFIGSDLDRQALARYEKGTINMKPKSLPPFAKAFDVPESFFMGEGVTIDKIKYRKSIANAEITESESRVVAEEIALLNQRFELYEQQAGRKTITEHLKCYNKTPEDAAAKLRRMWDLGSAPITSVVSLLESHGIRVFQCAMPDSMLGASTYCDRKHPVIALNDNKELSTTCRTRFSAMHELGHLVLTIPYGQNPERLCNRFASCMLLPRKALVSELGEKCEYVTEEDARHIHNVYGISIAALIHQAYDFGIISREHYDWWYDTKIHLDRKETHWGDYPIDETPQMESRLKSRLEPCK